MLGNSSQHPEFGHFTLECALNSSFHWFMRESWAWERPAADPSAAQASANPSPGLSTLPRPMGQTGYRSPGTSGMHPKQQGSTRPVLEASRTWSARPRPHTKA